MYKFDACDGYSGIETTLLLSTSYKMCKLLNKGHIFLRQCVVVKKIMIEGVGCLFAFFDSLMCLFSE